MNGVFLFLSSFLASSVEMVEALTIVLAVGLTPGWRSAMAGTYAAGTARDHHHPPRRRMTPRHLILTILLLCSPLATMPARGEGATFDLSALNAFAYPEAGLVKHTPGVRPD